MQSQGQSGGASPSGAASFSAPTCCSCNLCCAETHWTARLKIVGHITTRHALSSAGAQTGRCNRQKRTTDQLKVIRSLPCAAERARPLSSGANWPLGWPARRNLQRKQLDFGSKQAASSQLRQRQLARSADFLAAHQAGAKKNSQPSSQQSAACQSSQQPKGAAGSGRSMSLTPSSSTGDLGALGNLGNLGELASLAATKPAGPPVLVSVARTHKESAAEQEGQLQQQSQQQSQQQPQEQQQQQQSLATGTLGSVSGSVGPGSESDERDDEFDSSAPAAAIGATRFKANSISSCVRLLATCGWPKSAASQQPFGAWPAVGACQQAHCLHCELQRHLATLGQWTSCGPPAASVCGGQAATVCGRATVCGEWAQARASLDEQLQPSAAAQLQLQLQLQSPQSIAAHSQQQQQQQQQQAAGQQQSQNKDYLKPGDWLHSAHSAPCSAGALLMPRRRHSWICR